MPIKGLIFDLDGTVTLTQQFHEMAFEEVFKRHGLQYTADDDARFSGRGAHGTFPEFFKEHGIILTPEQIEQFAEEKHEVYAKIIHESQAQSVPGVEKFLERQKAKGMRMAMATGNQLQSTLYFLDKLGLEKYFEYIVTNDDIKNSKPAPDIFLKAAEKLELQPDECIVFEDAVNGVLGAKSAGMRCIALITTTPQEKLIAAGADHLVKNYDEVPDNFLQ